MSKRKKQTSPNAKPQLTPESKEKKRQRQARYRTKPEVRQKQLALMAERRRQWDPPHRNPPPAAPSPSLPVLPSSQSSALPDAEPDDHALTPAEDFAFYSRSPSPQSSVQAVIEHPVVEKSCDVGLYHKDRFPPYFGPITGIQNVQFLVSVLHGPIDEDDEDQPLAEQPVVACQGVVANGMQRDGPGFQDPSLVGFRRLKRERAEVEFQTAAMYMRTNCENALPRGGPVECKNALPREVPGVVAGAATWEAGCTSETRSHSPCAELVAVEKEGLLTVVLPLPQLSGDVANLVVRILAGNLSESTSRSSGKTVCRAVTNAHDIPLDVVEVAGREHRVHFLAQPLPTTVDDSNDDSLEYSPSPPPPANLWLAGMPPPLSPGAAAALALQERGPTAVAALTMQEREGAAVRPTMAIDPSLDLDVPFQPQPSLLFQAFQRDLPPSPPKPAPFVHPDTQPACFCKSLANYVPTLPPVVPAPAPLPVVTPTPPPIFTPTPPPVVTPAPLPVFTPVLLPVVTPAPPAPAKRRGHPPKAAAALADTTNHTVEEGSDGQGVLVHCHGVGDNRKAARAAAAQAKAAERNAAAEMLAAQRAKGWMHGPDGSVVLLRARKPARNPDGSARECKGIRAPQLDETEKAMLARAESVRAENEMLKGKKRKALAASAAPAVAKKRRTGA
ncbi:hypothetical protein B0H14DRAFT_2614938 [Mycena olivaceomarginata]|nr:hypothetical protein B0H14DRAFT_2614938 [Mycena olivaceomarginata]